MDSQQVHDIPSERCSAIQEVSERSEEAIDENSKCDFCLFENTEEEAVAFCMDCSEQLCSNCIREHRKNKSSRHHELLESADIINDVSVIKTIKKMMACPNHPETMVTYKCEDHERYVCASCLVENHQKCIKIDEISKANHAGYKNTCTSVMERLSLQKSIITASKLASEQRKARFEEQFDQLQYQKQRYFNSIYEKLSQAKQKLDSDIQALVKEELNCHEMITQKCQEVLVKEQEYQKLLEVTLKVGNPSEMNVIPNLILAEANSLSKTFETYNSKHECFLNFESAIDLDKIENIGKVSILHLSEREKIDGYTELCVSSEEVLEDDSTPNENKISGVDHVPTKSDMSTQTEEYPSIRPDGLTYSVRCQDDTLLSEIYAIVILPDGRVALIDNSNCKLKVLDEHFSFLFAMTFYNEPIDMCHVFDATVAVVYYDIREVTLYDISETHVIQTGSFRTKFEIVAVAKFGHGNNIAVLFKENNTHCIQIRNTDNGRILQVFHCELSPGVAFDFEENDNIKQMVCRGENSILSVLSEYWKVHCFIIPEGSKCVSHRDYCNIPQSWFFKSRRGNVCKDITDLATDEEGNIYVCGSESHNVHQIAAGDYRTNREIVSNIRTPLSIAVNSKEGYLIIGCKYDDFIHVYHFC